jgi:hypothetical protein
MYLRQPIGWFRDAEGDRPRLSAGHFTRWAALIVQLDAVTVTATVPIVPVLEVNEIEVVPAATAVTVNEVPEDGPTVAVVGSADSAVNDPA